MLLLASFYILTTSIMTITCITTPVSLPTQHLAARQFFPDEISIPLLQQDLSSPPSTLEQPGVSKRVIITEFCNGKLNPGAMNPAFSWRMRIEHVSVFIPVQAAVLGLQRATKNIPLAPPD